ncbi:hybrid sensor histidine kinase/response regulator [Mucilaginibacter sp. FT3.2]|uniref:hybrid sensor histidine kinase/response regulator n=1 Tax=Mucilaginibacter sp. FT3.2 TaxID=2723090 RepID=UPI00161F9763|nr:hybrid sensor histidine kinase/response regulator [Mucilaginibacter sp. FT3.2]MBB6232392.1 signal transduction histidine kinase/CheY-like chemotaxis protein [Mucilaginibacter sp. FT3.2]
MFYKKESTSSNIKSISRKILLAFIALVIALALIALFVNSNISSRLNALSKLTLNLEYDQAKSQKALLLLHEAEDDFQASLLTPDVLKNNAYKIKLSQSFSLIDSLLKDNIDTAKLTVAQRAKVKSLYLKKLKLSASLYVLKHSFDSLLTATSGVNTVNDNVGQYTTKTSRRKGSGLRSSDTVKSDGKINKKGFFGRIKDAIANKNGNAGVANLTVINRNRADKIIDSVNRRISGRDKDIYSKKLQQLQQRNSKLFTTQKQMIVLNMHINSELERIINEVNNINTGLVNELKESALKNYRETNSLLNKFYLSSLFLVLVFATLLIVFIINLNRAEVYLLHENERSVAMAQQKMDLLLHMSHEVRNPLTAINGFLYIFSRSNLSAKQIDMLSSIRLSSDMLLHTLNDTLDAAKMETSEFKINTEPFNPDHTLKQLMESMEFSAAKKNLKLDYGFEGNKGLMVAGDSFRLKQIMINLLSNAIKYTPTGSVKVNAKLLEINGADRLQISITDTGPGISIPQQGRLFSKYYQTSSAKGQTGTGLGLYICKQLVQLQDGEISVESSEGNGSTFSFYIPYKRSKVEAVENDTDNVLGKLNGLNMLIVDNNELSLIFLKMMTAKWNINFYQASDGKEALDILSKETIDVVLSDLAMTEMGAENFALSVNKSKTLLNKPPVIAISAEELTPQRDQQLKQSFTGVIEKPFTEAELIKKIVLAIGG